MKLLSIIIFQKKNEKLSVYKEAYELSHIGFFQRSTVKDFLMFFSKTVAEKIHNQRTIISEKGNNIYIYNNNNFIVTATTDAEYLTRVAFTMLDYILQELNTNEKFDLDAIIKKYQNPNEADKILKIQKDIESTKVVMLDAIDKVLARGEKIDDLVVKTQDLSDSSKIFYKDAKKMNSWCCSIQ
jgi:synaptobrevin homolog YKT6